LLSTIPGASATAARVLVAEIGVDMSMVRAADAVKRIAQRRLDVLRLTQCRLRVGLRY
jgi:hypothetical protein